MNWSHDIVVPVLPILPCARNQSCHPISIPSALSGKTRPHLQSWLMRECLKKISDEVVRVLKSD